MRKPFYLPLIGLLLLAGCHSPAYNSLAPISQPLRFQQQAIIESKFEYTSERTLLTARLKDDKGVLTVYETLRRPLAGTQVQAETIPFLNGQPNDRRPTTPAEAQLVLKVAASNGLADIYKDLRDRYRLAGLLGQ